MTLQIRHSQAPIAKTLMTDLSMAIRLWSPQSNLERDCFGAPEGPQTGGVRTISKESQGRRTWHTPKPCPLKTSAFETRLPPALLFLSVLLNNFAPVGGLVWTTPQECRQNSRSSERIQVGKHHLSKHLAADLCSCQSWPWLLPPTHTLQPPSAQPLCTNSETQKLSLAKAKILALTWPTRGNSNQS